MARPPLPPDAYVISYPKSGRTWLRVLLGKALCLRYELPSELMLDTAELTTAAGILRTEFVHDESELRDDLDYMSLSRDKHAYQGAKVAFLVRDPRDVLVSSYFEATRRSFLFDGTPLGFTGALSEFVRSPVFGIRKVAAFHDIWARNRDVPGQFLVLRYEQLREAPAAVLRSLLRFLGAGEVVNEHVEAAVAYAGLENLRKLEGEDAFGDPRLRPGDPSDRESYKVRRGLVGGYVDYLSAADVGYIDRELSALASPLIQRARD